MDSKLVVSIVLVGQPALKTMLQKPKLVEITSRLNHCGEIRLLNRDETERYLDTRSRAAGSNTNLFDEQAIEAIFEITRGNMRAIDRLALESINTLIQDGNDQVSPETVVKARGQLWM